MYTTPTPPNDFVVPPGLFLFIGPPGCGKSHLAVQLSANLDAAAVVSTDALRALPEFGGDAADQTSSTRVHARAKLIAHQRLNSHLSVIYDTTGLNGTDRKSLAGFAKAALMPATALLAVTRSDAELIARDADPSRGRSVGPEVIAKFQPRHRAITVDALLAEGFDSVIVFDDNTRIRIAL